MIPDLLCRAGSIPLAVPPQYLQEPGPVEDVAHPQPVGSRHVFHAQETDVLEGQVFAPDHRAGRDLAARAFEQLGYQAESATWRNAYLYAAQELRNGVMKLPPRPILSPDLLGAVDTNILFDFIAV